jgi:hypothetical protein
MVGAIDAPDTGAAVTGTRRSTMAGVSAADLGAGMAVTGDAAVESVVTGGDTGVGCRGTSNGVTATTTPVSRRARKKRFSISELCEG